MIVRSHPTSQPQSRSGRLLSLREAGAGVRVLELELDRPLAFQPLQCVAMVSANGTNRWLPILSDPERAGRLELGLLRPGAGHTPAEPPMSADLVIRGPFGNGVSPDALDARQVLVVGESDGIAVLRSLTRSCRGGSLLRRQLAASAFFGGRHARDLPFREELKELSIRDGLPMRWTVEQPETGWDGSVGVVPVLFRGLRLEPAATLAVVAGPGPSVKFVVLELLMRGVPEAEIFVVPEIGPCAGADPCDACAGGARYVCRRGPVFTWPELRAAGKSR